MIFLKYVKKNIPVWSFDDLWAASKIIKKLSENILYTAPAIESPHFVE